MKEILSLTWKLLLICLIVAVALAGINAITSPIIAANDAATFETAMKEVLPSATSFEEANPEDITLSESGVSVNSAYVADAGFVINAVCHEGYGGDVDLMVGINQDLTVNTVKIMSMSETPGLGAKANDASFTEQYQGISDKAAVIKNAEPKENEIEAISGATITSKAVTKAVNAALETAQQLKGGQAQ